MRHLKSKSYLKHPGPLANAETTSDPKSHLNFLLQFQLFGWLMLILVLIMTPSRTAHAANSTTTHQGISPNAIQGIQLPNEDIKSLKIRYKNADCKISPPLFWMSQNTPLLHEVTEHEMKEYPTLLLTLTGVWVVFIFYYCWPEILTDTIWRCCAGFANILWLTNFVNLRFAGSLPPLLGNSVANKRKISMLKSWDLWVSHNRPR